ncbi:MAG: formate--tetrahydrofolate ligase [Bacilli bacterium]|nr:formate--tetrahydrofolate ligase [Bacilli bacterium]
MNELNIEDKCVKLNIVSVAKKINLNKKDLILYGNDKAKIIVNNFDIKGKLILVTSINPTIYGEGKTTVTIGINAALRKLNINSLAVLREPSLGPVFGIKGGATGGGYSQVTPSLDINLHFTGDMHAITSANNLICAIIDNHIYQGNKLNIDENKIEFNRCIDMNDRALRNIKLSNRDESFNITAASEIMAILCLSNDEYELRNKLNNILIGFSYDNKPIYVEDLNITNALYLLLKDAFKPNLVQDLENNPVIIHGGPFANIAHGCNSLVATKFALSKSDYVITEAGFGSDLGGEKFFDIKCRYGNIKPFLTIINVTVKALKHHGNGILKEGILNLKTHIENMKLFNSNLLVVLNKFEDDNNEDIVFIKDYVNNLGVDIKISESYLLGGKGSLDIAKYIINLKGNNDFKYLYNLDDNIENKINTICTKIYHSNNVIFENDILNKIEQINNLGLSNLPICIAKTPNSFSSDPKLLGSPTNYNIKIKDIKINSGAGFIVVYLGDIMTMPGLPKVPKAVNM